MGTRNSTIVKLEGEIKVAQYGQWDGYPTGQGEVIANFLRGVDLPRFKEQVKNLTEISESKLKRLWFSLGADPKSTLVSMEISDKFSKLYPEYHRNTGAGILQLVHDGKVTEVSLDKEFKDDDLMCEYWYEIDLDKETVTMNGQVYTFEQWVIPGFMEALENR